MKKFFAVLGLLVLAPLLSAAGDDFVSTEGAASRILKERALPPVPAVKVERDWTVLVFANGRGDLSSDMLQDVRDMEEVGSTNKVAFVVQLALMDGSRGAKRYFITKNSGSSGLESPVVDNVPVADMGSSYELVRFVKWGISKYPAKRYALIIGSHGVGWANPWGAVGDGEKAISPDFVTMSFIGNKEMGAAMAEIAAAVGHKLDLYASDACGMQMLEILSELKESVRVVVGSEEKIPGAGFPYKRIFGDLAANPGASAEDFGRLMTRSFASAYSRGTSGLSAVRTSAVDILIKRLDEWIHAVYEADKLCDSRNAAIEAKRNTTSFFAYDRSRDADGNPSSKDLKEFVMLTKLSCHSGAQAAETEKKNLLDTFAYTVISYDIASADYSNTGGIAVYMPREIYRSAYDEETFAANSSWGEFMKWLLDAQYKVE